ALDSPETIASGLLTPAYVRVGDTVASELHVYSTGPTTATLNLSVDGAVVNTRPITLTSGDNLIPLAQTAQAPGFHRLAAVVTAAHDGQPDNNTALATLVVKPPPRVLILEERSGESAPLVAALTARQIAVDVRAPSTVPAQAAGLAGYDSIILDNVAATSLTLDQQRTLQAAVQRNGRGLVVIGGPTSYARGGYADSVLEDMLPVSSDPKPRPAQGATALILVLDHSSSMTQGAGDVVNGLGASKLVMGKEAARQSVDALHDGDSVGVLTFDTATTWAVPVTTIAGTTSKDQIKTGISNIPIGGGTNIQGALDTAFAEINQLPARIRHIVLLTDGYEFGTHDYSPLYAGLQAGDISLTTVGLGRGADRGLLTRLAQGGGGRAYFTEQTSTIPQIVIKDVNISLKETTVEGQTAARSQAASPLLRDISPAQLPPLAGYDLTGAKPDAVTALVTDDGDPLLAHWQYGLGRVVAFTSGAGPGWAASWAGWAGFPDFWNSVVRWAMANPVDRELQPAITVSAAGTATGLALAHLSVESLQPDSTFADLAALTAALRAPSGVITTTRLTQTAPGRYEAAVPLSETGAYEVRVTRQAAGAADQTETAGFTVPISAELLHAGTNDALLRRLAAGQAMLTDPAQALAGRTPQPATADGPPLWPYPLGLALLALLGGVAVRRLDFRFRR
ncbi:MAG: glutamine amidotransferase, partial [Chloroflexota bacterium]|nr:glutamine amidotransferase [Chloroflexota bacterium]